VSFFELFVARRYLRAKRKQAVISVITVISVAGVAAGVMALVIALAINNGFRTTLERSLLGATAHVTITERHPAYGIDHWDKLVPRLVKIPHVLRVEPSLYGYVLFAGPVQSKGGEMKGIPVDSPPDMLRHLKAGSFSRLRDPGGLPGIILGSHLADDTGMMLNSVVKVISPQGELTPFGPRVTTFRFRVVGIFESGFYDIDDQWAFAGLSDVQRVFSLPDVVNAIEIKLDDIYDAPEAAAAAQSVVGAKLAAGTWMEQFHQILTALRMERTVTAVTVGLIELVAALNILITLTMMVMEKNRDIAILMSLGARRQQVRRIFLAEGLLIGITGTAIGLILGYSVSILASHYRWLRLDQDVYALSYVPFDPRWIDGVWIAAVAVFVSFAATLYPARQATRILPAEALRYE
jgi:lipoprotein-releasing system permease protein